MTPLVSILIPAYNAERWIGDTIRSALEQTWLRKEIIIVDDGSRDRTLSIARHFASKDVAVVAQENQGASAARNKSLELCQGDYIQWLDADDLLAPDKIARQMSVVEGLQSKRTLLSCGWARFFYRPNRSRLVPTTLWSDLTPAEWLMCKIGENLQMPLESWLVSREVSQVAKPWDTRLSLDDDGEYFCRVVLASDGIRFVPNTVVFYRRSGEDSLNNVDESYRKLASLLLSTRLQVRYLLSLEESERTRAACLKCLQKIFIRFYPEQPGLAQELHELAATLGGELEIPKLPWKYSWLQKAFGWTTAKRAQRYYNRLKSSIMRCWDKVACHVEHHAIAIDDKRRATTVNKLVPLP